MAGKDGRLHCRFCSWSTNKFYTTKKGEVRGPDTAWARLREHMLNCHEDEMPEGFFSDEFGSFDPPKKRPPLQPWEEGREEPLDPREDWEDLTW